MSGTEAIVGRFEVALIPQGYGSVGEVWRGQGWQTGETVGAKLGHQRPSGEEVSLTTSRSNRAAFLSTSTFYDRMQSVGGGRTCGTIPTPATPPATHHTDQAERRAPCPGPTSASSATSPRPT